MESDAPPTLSPSSLEALGLSATRSSSDHDARRAQAIELLRSREDTAQPVDLSSIQLQGADLSEANLSGLDLFGIDLRGANLCRARLNDTKLMRADLSGANLFEAELRGAELAGANLKGANLNSTQLRCAGLGHANLESADLSNAQLQGATLTEANLERACLCLAGMSDVRAREACFDHADLTRAKLFQADLEGSSFEGANMNAVCLRGANVSRLQGFQKATWIGVDLRDIDFTGAHLFRNFVLDQNYIEEFRNQSRWTLLIYHIWSLTSDCGRSISRWTAWIFAMVLFYAALYSFVEIDYGSYETDLSPIYFSVVTLTTLGFGDALPTDVSGQLIVMAEVFTGYVMLGGLLSIFSGKIASRAN